MLWSCENVYNEIYVNITCKVKIIATSFYNFHIGTYIYLWHYCQRGRRWLKGEDDKKDERTNKRWEKLEEGGEYVRRC